MIFVWSLLIQENSSPSQVAVGWTCTGLFVTDKTQGIGWSVLSADCRIPSEQMTRYSEWWLALVQLTFFCQLLTLVLFQNRLMDLNPPRFYLTFQNLNLCLTLIEWLSFCIETNITYFLTIFSLNQLSSWFFNWRTKKNSYLKHSISLCTRQFNTFSRKLRFFIIWQRRWQKAYHNYKVTIRIDLR